MLLVEVEVKESPGKGNGIFAKHFIPKGTVVYTEGGFCQTFTPEQIEKMPEVKQVWLRKYATWHISDNVWHLCTDDARVWNHSFDANVRYVEEDSLDMLAVRDIAAGEELTCDYTEFADNFSDGNFDFEVKD